MDGGITKPLRRIVLLIGAAGALYFAPEPLAQTTSGDRSASLRTGDRPLNQVHDRQHLDAHQKWQVAGRKLPGQNPAALRGHALRQKLQMRATHLSSNAPVSGAWVSLGPMPLPSDASGTGLQDYNWVSGRATAVVIDPNDLSGNTVFAGGAYAGIWKSINAGTLSLNPSSVTWIPLTDAQATLAIGSIAVQPQLSNPNPAQSVILAGTGETDSSTDSYYGLGILRSADGGQTWTLVTQDTTKTHPFAGLGFSQIAFNTANPNLVVAAAGAASQGIVEGLEDPLAVNRGLYYSTDAGLSWQATTVTDSSVNITPDSATAVVFNAAAGTFYAAIRFHGFYSSPDGINWTRLANQPGTGLTSTACPAQAASPSACPIYRGQIAFVPGRPGPSNLGEMYVWFVDASDNDQGIWQSVDGGVSWLQINESGITNCEDFFGGCGTEEGTFNLTLTAVADGSGTDLYAGAVNIYKCEITVTNPTCNGTGTNTFLNLTHVYGCSDIAKVHPGQHAVDFLVGNGAALLYFANDGGIYRSLNGYTGLITDSCGQSNQFDSLNQTLGPMTQLVSIAQPATDVNLILAGAQDNGSPATAFSQSAGDWVNVNAGDNGFTAINPANENEWFVAAPPDSVSGVNVFRCTKGIDCHSSDFQNDEIADSNALDGDSGAFYLPFILDPQNSSTLILGTCRVWGGPTSGSSFSLLSPDFETGGSGTCSGDEINLVRSLAAGGPKNTNGNSQVIYAGTNGEGPLISTVPTGGHVWVTSNADGGPLTWTDVTQAINPGGFPISAIALDPSDVTGETAYVTIMGFHTPHVWKTTNAGLAWMDFSGTAPNALPDAPVNAIVIAPGASPTNGTVYVGTDVGVFASSTGAASWTEVGPTTGTGFLPNVAVTSLQIFNSGGLKRLRAATYGRGIWEWNLVTTPDFQINVSDDPLTILPAQTAIFNGIIYALNGYNSNVNLSCTAGTTNPPPTCGVVPITVLPTAAGTNFSANTSGNVGDYEFNLHAAGADSASVTQDFALVLHVVDFSLGAPSPNQVSVSPGTTSAPVTFQVAALGSFAGSVALSCSNLPAGASCQFKPSSSVSLVSGSPVSVTLNITTSSSTPMGNFPITINAITAGEAAKTQSLALAVGTTPDYSLNIPNASATAAVNTPATFNGALTAMNGYASAVSLSCGSGKPPTCTINPASAIPSSIGVSFAVTVSSNVSQPYNFSIVAAGSDTSAITHSAAVSFTATPSQSFDFTMGITPASASTPVGQPANFNLEVNPTTGSFPNNVTFSCSKLPALTTCGFNPTQVGQGSQNSAVAFTIITTAPVPANLVPVTPLFSAFPIAALVSMKRRRLQLTIHRFLLTNLLLLAVLGVLSCGGGLQGGGGSSGSPGTPSGTYNITVTATCGSVTHDARVSLTVTP